MDRKAKDRSSQNETKFLRFLKNNNSNNKKKEKKNPTSYPYSDKDHPKEDRYNPTDKITNSKQRNLSSSNHSTKKLNNPLTTKKLFLSGTEGLIGNGKGRISQYQTKEHNRTIAIHRRRINNNNQSKKIGLNRDLNRGNGILKRTTTTLRIRTRTKEEKELEKKKICVRYRRLIADTSILIEILNVSILFAQIELLKLTMNLDRVLSIKKAQAEMVKEKKSIRARNFILTSSFTNPVKLMIAKESNKREQLKFKIIGGQMKVEELKIKANLKVQGGIGTKIGIGRRPTDRKTRKKMIEIELNQKGISRYIIKASKASILKRKISRKWLLKNKKERIDLMRIRVRYYKRFKNRRKKYYYRSRKSWTEFRINRYRRLLRSPIKPSIKLVLNKKIGLIRAGKDTTHQRREYGTLDVRKAQNMSSSTHNRLWTHRERSNSYRYSNSYIYNYRKKNTSSPNQKLLSIVENLIIKLNITKTHQRLKDLNTALTDTASPTYPGYPVGKGKNHKVHNKIQIFNKTKLKTKVIGYRIGGKKKKIVRKSITSSARPTVRGSGIALLRRENPTLQKEREYDTSEEREKRERRRCTRITGVKTLRTGTAPRNPRTGSEILLPLPLTQTSPALRTVGLLYRGKGSLRDTDTNYSEQLYPKVSRRSVTLNFGFTPWKDISTISTLHPSLFKYSDIAEPTNNGPSISLKNTVPSSYDPLTSPSFNPLQGRGWTSKGKVRREEVQYPEREKNMLVKPNVMLLVKEGIPFFSLKNKIPSNIFNVAFNKKQPRINQLVKQISSINLRKSGVSIFHSQIIAFSFIFGLETNKIIKNVYKFLYSAFVSMSCLISKPVFVITPDKIVVQLFFFIAKSLKKDWAKFYSPTKGLRYYKSPLQKRKELKALRRRRWAQRYTQIKDGSRVNPTETTKGIQFLKDKNYYALKAQSLKNSGNIEAKKRSHPTVWGTRTKTEAVAEAEAEQKYTLGASLCHQFYPYGQGGSRSPKEKRLTKDRVRRTKAKGKSKRRPNAKRRLWLNPFLFERRYTLKLKLICGVLSRIFKKPVVLDLIRLHYPYYDNNILVSLLGKVIKKVKVRVFVKKVLRKIVTQLPIKLKYRKPNIFTPIPAFVSGISVRVAGRLMTEKKIPRKTVKKANRGATATGKVNFVDTARLVKKNKRGAFSATITSGQFFV